MSRWQIRVDVGGTFTDCIAYDPAGGYHVAKVLSSGDLRAPIEAVDGRAVTLPASWADRVSLLKGAIARRPGEQVSARIEAVDGSTITLAEELDLANASQIELTTNEPAPILAARLITRTPFGEPIPVCDFRLATTRATNALLERKAAPTALLVSEGFGDVLRIGDQTRPDVYALSPRRRPTITEHTYEIPARLGPTGHVVIELDEAASRDAIERAKRDGVETIAIALINAWVDPSQERRVAELAREAGFETVVCSADVTPRIGLLHRAQAAATDAALAPILNAYLAQVAQPLAEGSTLTVLSSAGGLTPADRFRPVDTLLSGPAGGVVGAASAGRRAGFDQVLSFDMGGTSTDVARLSTGGGGADLAPSHTVGDVTIARPAVAIETVAAGGGSVCHARDGRPAVGPHSAGASPGPACYGAGGPLAITDVNLLLGRIDPTAFEIPIDAEASRRALEALQEQLDDDIEPDALLAGLLELANETMAEAIRSVSIRKGYDPADHALVAFGGAGPQHACDIAERLGVRAVVIPPDASLLSAVGLHAARHEEIAERTLLVPLAASEEQVRTTLAELSGHAEDGLRSRIDGDIEIRPAALMRLVGQDATITIDADDIARLRERFEDRYRVLHGHLPEREIEVVTLRVIARAIDVPTTPPARGTMASSAASQRRVHDGTRWIEARVHDRDAIDADTPIEGPAIVSEQRTQTWIPRGWRCSVDQAGALRIDRESTATRSSGSDALARELIVHRLAAISEQMGEALETAAVSVNVKDRRDYSCGVLDAAGVLASSAAHMPVHLGALGPCVQAVIAEIGHLEDEDAVLVNHPAFGGSHLPDLNVIQPVFDEAGVRVAYVASRAHHAEVGGLTPGSMPPDATCLADEGVPIRPTFIARRNTPQLGNARELFLGHRLPTRAVEDNIADLEAAVTAGRRAADLVRQLAAERGTDQLTGAMRWINEHTARVVENRIASIANLPASTVEHLDGGAEIHLTISSHAGRLRVDFTGTSKTQPVAINAPLAVTRAAVAYVLRLLIDEPIPLNDGFLGPVDVIVPEGCFLNPVFDPDPEIAPPVAGGNVETSMRVVDAMLTALDLCAGGPGTMNNTLIGNDGFGIYETICNGAPATATSHGEHAIHQHMTNTAITDAEILERRYPVRVRRYEIRRGSGGRGKLNGGDGAIREIEAIEPMTATVLTHRRSAGPPGKHGGQPGEIGINQIRRADGSTETLKWADTTRLDPGDRIRIHTPGAGGWGKPHR
ncbi:MAG: hydantoinase B/oxoprolinase family protein [Planctomycetota bacterium]